MLAIHTHKTMIGVPYNLTEPKGKRVPFILSIPHCGTEFPSDLIDQYEPKLIETLDDTDWNLDKLYDFASSLGVTTIYAKYSRWVIDLNREPGSMPLYDDGRLITALCPTTDFERNDLYVKKEYEPDGEQIERRLEHYFYPYHQKIDSLIKELKAEFGKVLFWDAHSIRRYVKTIQKEPFPDLILGNNDCKTAEVSLIDRALSSLSAQSYSVNHNDPFKGGFLTRSKGDLKNGVNALQLEMSKDLYMKDNETIYDEDKAAPIRELLTATFESLIDTI